ncbi:MAG: 3-deoxy-D-manno-octulosonic acid transferase [Orrella sp.]
MLARWIYSLLLIMAAPLALGLLMWRRRARQDDWQALAAERFGFYPQPWDGAPPIWIHAVSVGEVRAAAPLIKALILKGDTVLLTHFTPTGRTEGQRLLAQEIHDGRVRQQWVPYDLASAMCRFLNHFQPRLALLVEREVWPNLVHTTHMAGVPVVLVSARLSERSLTQAVWINRLFGGLLHDTYGELELALAQTPEDGQRLFDSGVSKIIISGNLKFDIDVPLVAVEAGEHWRTRLNRPVITIASTREGEDKLFVPLIAANLKPMPAGERPLYILIPRHPQRFDDAARLLDAHQLRYARWSMLADDPQSDEALKKQDVVLGDTMGELPFFYGVADVAIVGGSFENHGGQNFIEACAIGTPVIVGPHTRNFAHAVQDAVAAGALVQVKTAAQAIERALLWLEDPDSATTVGLTGKAWVSDHVGATKRIVQALTELEAVQVKPSGLAR